MSAVNFTGLAEGSGIREEIVGGTAKSSAARTSASALQCAVTNEVSSILIHRAAKLARWVMDSTTGVPGSKSGSIFFKPIAPHK